MKQYLQPNLLVLEMNICYKCKIIPRHLLRFIFKIYNVQSHICLPLFSFYDLSEWRWKTTRRESIYARFSRNMWGERAHVMTCTELTGCQAFNYKTSYGWCSVYTIGPLNKSSFHKTERISMFTPILVYYLRLVQTIELHLLSPSQNHSCVPAATSQVWMMNDHDELVKNAFILTANSILATQISQCETFYFVVWSLIFRVQNTVEIIITKYCLQNKSKTFSLSTLFFNRLSYRLLKLCRLFCHWKDVSI